MPSDFPGGSVVRTPCFQCWDAGGVGSIPGWGTKITHAAQHGQNHQKKKKKKLAHETQQQTTQLKNGQRI